MMTTAFTDLGLRPEDVDRRSCDMYSFAVILWEIATGKIPFQGLSPMQVGIKVNTPSQIYYVREFVYRL